MKKRLLSLFLALVMILSVISTAAAASPGLKNFKQVNTYTDGQFTDVPSDAWYASTVIRAYEMGLVKGVSDAAFNPTGNITIAETLALACRLHSIYSGKDGSFEQGDPWYQVYADYAEKNSLLDDVQFKSYTELATRAQFATIFANAMPSSALKAINEVKNGQVPDVSASTSIGKAVYMLYKAGILTGSDEYGTFHPDSKISRAEVATIATRMADESLRVTLTLKKHGVDMAYYEELYEEFVASVKDMEKFGECILTAMRSNNVSKQLTLLTQAKDYAKTTLDTLTTLEAKCGDHAVLKELKASLQKAATVLQTVLKADFTKELQETHSLSGAIYFMYTAFGTYVTAAELVETDFQLVYYDILD